MMRLRIAGDEPDAPPIRRRPQSPRRGFRPPLQLTSRGRTTTSLIRRAPSGARRTRPGAPERETTGKRGERPVGSVIKKRRKKMRKHKKRKLLRRARHKRKR